MSWQDRDYGDDGADRMGRPGGDWQGVRPTFDNPMSWSIPLGRVIGIVVRVHIVFLIYIVIRLARSLASPDAAEAAPLGFALTALQLGCLFGIVLLHEFGHCIACRRTGGEADEILMWPLGGLAFCRPEQRWQAHLVTAVGGPAVNVAILIILAPVMAVICQSWGAAIPNPLMPHLPLLPDGRQPWWLLALFFIHHINLILLLFNLLPIFPLDGGRIAQAALWPRFGYVMSMRLAVYAGYIGAIGLFIFGAVFVQWILIAIAAFGGITCWLTLKQLQWTEAVMGGGTDEYAASLWGDDDEEKKEKKQKKRGPDRAERRRRRREKAAEEEAAEVDRILNKIAEKGMDSLSRREKGLLKRATARRQQGGEGG
ncbi:MAG: site-2 protease family protein [Planctomycetota bacterium]|nr:site-2 protease family protein [Planctomycetota bacterium]